MFQHFELTLRKCSLFRSQNVGMFFDDLPNALIIADSQGLVYANQVAKKTFDVGEDKNLMTKRLWKLLRDEHESLRGVKQC